MNSLALCEKDDGRLPMGCWSICVGAKRTATARTGSGAGPRSIFVSWPTHISSVWFRQIRIVIVPLLNMAIQITKIPSPSHMFPRIHRVSSRPTDAGFCRARIKGRELSDISLLISFPNAWGVD